MRWYSNFCCLTICETERVVNRMWKKDKDIVISRKHLTVIGIIALVLVFFLGYGFAYHNWGMALANRFPFKYFAGNSALGKYLQVNSLINEEYIGQADQDELNEQAISGMMYGLDDPYSFYLTPEQAEQERVDNSGVYGLYGKPLYNSKS